MDSIDELAEQLEQKLVITGVVHSKKLKGQFYSVNAKAILQGLRAPCLADENIEVIEPFVGQGDLIKYIRSEHSYNGQIVCYDVQPLEQKTNDPSTHFTQQDTLLHPPDYGNKFILTNPPFLAGNKSKDVVTKQILNKYDTDDLFKCAVLSFVQSSPVLPRAGMLILPVAFFLSMDVVCRSQFMRRFRIPRINYFERQMFPDTTVCVVAFAFERSDTELTMQRVEWYKWDNDESHPDPVCRTFEMRADCNWMVGGEIHSLPKSVLFGRVPAGGACRTNVYPTHLTLKSTDTSGGVDGHDIGLTLEDMDFKMPEIKTTDRTSAVVSFKGRALTRDEQQRLCGKFNRFIREKRAEYWSLWLPPFRDNGRHRLGFDTAYAIMQHLFEDVR